MLREEIERAARGRGCSARTCSAPAGGCRLEIFTSPGGYILGEESALLECMEGHRGEPRNKPPFPGIYGLWGKPTLMNSVETFADVPIIVERGAEWWKEQGVERRDRAEVLRRVRPRRAAGRLLRARWAPPRASLIELAGGVTGGREVGGVPARRRVLELPRPRAPRRPAGLEAAAGGRLDARLRRADGHGRGHGPARPRARTCCASSATSRAASACPAGSARPRRTRSSPSLLEQGKRPRGRRTTSIVELEETLRMTSICGLGQVALGPVISVLGLERGGAEAREHPKDRQRTPST